MKITKDILKQLIKEELRKVVAEKERDAKFTMGKSTITVPGFTEEQSDEIIRLGGIVKHNQETIKKIITYLPGLAKQVKSHSHVREE